MQQGQCTADSANNWNSQLNRINAKEIKTITAAAGAKTLATPAAKRSRVRRDPKNGK
jgi:hypothetical protein